MTHAQLHLYTRAVERANRRALLDQVINLRAAQYDKKAFNDYIRALQK